jgi:nucleoid-associated protein YgaU
MGLFDFFRSAGKAVGPSTAEAAPAPTAEDIKKEVASHGLPTENLNVSVDNGVVKLDGGAALDQETKEKVILAAGNVAGVGQVSEEIPTTADAAPASVFYTVVKGDTLSAIAKKQYGNANKYPAIFEANKPMLTHPDKIYPGQVLRIPPLS